MCAYVRSLNLADARWCAQALRMELGFVDAEGAELHGAGGGEGYGEGSYTFTPAVCKACLGKHVKHICGRSREDGACAMCDRCHVPRRALEQTPRALTSCCRGNNTTAEMLREMGSSVCEVGRARGPYAAAAAAVQRLVPFKVRPQLRPSHACLRFVRPVLCCAVLCCAVLYPLILSVMTHIKYRLQLYVMCGASMCGAALCAVSQSGAHDAQGLALDSVLVAPSVPVAAGETISHGLTFTLVLT